MTQGASTPGNDGVQFERDLKVHETTIPGLQLVDLPVHGDNRGWFKENWQRAKMVKAGLPAWFTPVQNNISFNEYRGTTRGIHAEPWNKFISLATGSVFGAWVDLRAGSSTYGRVFTTVLRPDRAIFVPAGVGNAFQALEDRTAYAYLVDAHWSATRLSQYSFVNLADPALQIAWPIPLAEAELSEKDQHHPDLAQARPYQGRRTLILGGNGQLGRALTTRFPDAIVTTRDTLDLTTPDLESVWDWDQIGVVINAAAYTNVDEAETTEGRRTSWAVNASGVANLARVAIHHNLTLVHISTDYVFDGEETEHPTDEPLAPLNTYGASKAAGELAVSLVPRHYLIRTSWVVGDGHNFITTMRTLARKGASPKVVNDQHGRLTHTNTLANAIAQLLESHAPFGTYNVTDPGPTQTWAQIAKHVYQEEHRNPNDITPVTTTQYYQHTNTPHATRPTHSTLTLPTDQG